MMSTWRPANLNPEACYSIHVQQYIFLAISSYILQLLIFIVAIAYIDLRRTAM